MLHHLRTLRGTLVICALLALASVPFWPIVTAQSTGAPGGFIEMATTSSARAKLSASQVAGFLPASRGAFTFPAPYNTTGYRLTTPADCGGTDCVTPVGYSYWANMNNSAGSNTLYAFITLAGHGGPTLFSLNKTTGVVTNLGPLFSSSDPDGLNGATGEGWYFSATQPTVLYVNAWPGRLIRYDILAKTKQTVFDATAHFGSDKYIWQLHSSHDGRVHSFTLRQNGTWAMLGCAVYSENTGQYSYFPSKTGDFDECQIDQSGRYLLIKEDVDGRNGEDNVVEDLQTGTERILLDEDGAGGHSDMGFGYMVAEDNWFPLAGATRLWYFDRPFTDPSQGQLMNHFPRWDNGSVSEDHFTHINAIAAPPDQQYGCSSHTTDDVAQTRGNEIYCYPLDGSLRVLVVAPTMVDVAAAGGGSDMYSKLPKANLDPTGQYIMWTSNMEGNGSRGDAFIVRVPSQVLTGSAPITPVSDTVHPTVSITSPGNGTGVSGTITVAATASDNVAVAGVQFQVNGVNLGPELTSSPYTLSWNTGSGANGSYTLRAIARDTSGNQTTSAAVTVSVNNATSSSSSSSSSGSGSSSNSGSSSSSSSGSSSSSSSGSSSGSGSTGGCKTPDPFTALGGGTCVNGNWLPPGMDSSSHPSSSGSTGTTGSTGSSSSSSPSSPSSSSGGCTTPDPFSALGGGTCANGNWLPPGMTVTAATSGKTSSSSGSTSSSSGSSGSSGSSSGSGSTSTNSAGRCVTPDPFTALGGGTCSNGSWLPPATPIASGGSPSQTSGDSTSSGSTKTTTKTTTSTGCATADPFTALGGGTCVSGNWLPPGMAAPSTSTGSVSDSSSTTSGSTGQTGFRFFLKGQIGSSSGCATPDPFVGIPGLSGVCINGNWIPRQ
jgi:Bacterial Ig domain